MTPEEIKSKVQGTHGRAMENRSMQRQRYSSISDLFRDVKLYGREAGVDFVETHLQRIVNEAVDTAECKDGSLELTAYGFGRAALEGRAQALRDLTALTVEADKSTIRLVWAEPNPVHGRSRIEQTFGKLKRFKRVAFRCETAESYAAFVSLALGFIIIKSVHTA